MQMRKKECQGTERKVKGLKKNNICEEKKGGENKDGRAKCR